MVLHFEKAEVCHGLVSLQQSRERPSRPPPQSCALESLDGVFKAARQCAEHLALWRTRCVLVLSVASLLSSGHICSTVGRRSNRGIASLSRLAPPHCSVSLLSRALLNSS